MARPFPYTFISCPCADTPVPDHLRMKRRSRDSPRKANFEQSGSGDGKENKVEEVEEEEGTFDPRSPRANFSLYPPEQLLYCEDCHQIKCPRCITEEIVSWYCPNCLFETPSSMVRSEGNRCARNCFSCPICTAPLTVSPVDSGSQNQQGPWVLACAYCMWTTLDIGIKFDKPTNLRIQLSKMIDSIQGKPASSRSFGELKSPLSRYSSIDEPSTPASENPTENEETLLDDQPALAPEARFAALKLFYRNQISETSASPTDPLGSDFGLGFSSPGALNRIMSIYTSTLGGLYGGSKKPKSKPPVMREALNASEGLKIPAADAEDHIIQKMASDNRAWDGLASIEQRKFQPPDARFVDDLLPLPMLLRTKRSKRCKSCKHILVKPESKPQSTRFRIRLIALSYIPLPTLRPLTLGPNPNPLIPSSTVASIPNLDALPPLKPIQLLLTLKNHMFDPVRVTLATPSTTPGRIATKVTILCPQFDIGANSDVWDEALQQASGDIRPNRPGMPGHEKVAEAGKVWDKGRNWTTVALEVVPGTLPEGPEKGYSAPTANSDDASNDDGDGLPKLDLTRHQSRNDADHRYGLQEDEDVLEIPVFVRMEWDSENQIEQPVVGKGQKPDTVKRELAYWMVLGVGRIKADS